MPKSDLPLKDLSSGRLLKLTSLTLRIWSENMLKTLALAKNKIIEIIR